MAWKEVSSETLPDLTIIKTWTGSEKSPFHDRWIVFNDKLQALWLGPSINSIGNQISNIRFVHQEEDNKQLQNNIIIPFVKEGVKLFDSLPVKYDKFDVFFD